MSAATQQAHADFATALRDAENMIYLSANLQEGRGRRHRAPSLHRSAVVLTVAAWQAFVEDTTTAILDGLAVPQGHPGYPLYRLVRAATVRGVRGLNTADARNSLALFSHVGYDPERHWRFTIGDPPRAYHPQLARQELDDWLDIRHVIAHGAQLPANHLVTGRPRTGPSLWRKDAERCAEFFVAVVAATATEADNQFP